MISSLIFVACLVIGIGLFAKKISKIRRNILLGKDITINDRKEERLKTMLLVALGQSKMITRPIAGFFHILIYIGFVIINLEVLEIVIDGITGKHRIFAEYLGEMYGTFIGIFEWLALGVVVACVVFLWRRNFAKVKRFNHPDLQGFPWKDANYILVIELILMGAFLKMNAADLALQILGSEHYVQTGSFPISQFLVPIFSTFPESTLIFMERTFWWLHILGILAFLNYLPYSKHFHILMAFPNTYYSKLEPKGKFENMEAVTREVQLIFNPDAAISAPPTDAPQKFGAQDVEDLTWKNLMDAYSCTECGRCTSVCPANQTGKLLSPRAIMMKTRDRLEEVGNLIDKTGKLEVDGKTLLGDYITAEELWACTTCNACVEACPVNINPLEIIMDLRQYLVMEKASAPTELNNVFSNIENNGAPWQFSPSDRFNWANEN